MTGIAFTNVPAIKKKKEELKLYGVSYNINDSNPALTRLHEAVGMTANVGTSLTATPLNDFDNIHPFNKITEETISSRVMIKIPKFYIRRELVGTTMEIVICEKKYDDSYIPHEMFLKGNTQWTGSNPETDYNDYTYVSKYETSTTGTMSIANVAVQVSQTISTSRTNARAIGSGWSILDIVTWDGLQKLFMIVFATRNSRNIMVGNYSGSFQKTGLTTGSKASCVQISNTAMAFYGIENLYSNVFKFVDGISFSLNSIHVSTNISQYIDDKNASYRTLNYSKVATTGYIKTLGFDTNNKFAQIATNVDGSNTTFFTNNFVPNTTTTWNVLYVGSYSSSSQLQYGLFHSATVANTSVLGSRGSRLIYRPI